MVHWFICIHTLHAEVHNIYTILHIHIYYLAHVIHRMSRPSSSIGTI